MSENINADQITCPYCGWVDNDSWEFVSDEEETMECPDCEKTFNVSRQLEVSYITSKIKCDDNKHNYKLDRFHISKRKYIKGNIWEELPETEWKYYKIMQCTICDDVDFVNITEDEYKNLTNDK